MVALFGQPADTDQKLNAVAAIHGAAGVFAVAGYRMGEHALKEWNLPKGSFAIEVIHHTPSEVQWSCIADGLQASTGVSAGKLNLKIVESPREAVRTVVRNRKTGQQIVFELQPAFVQQFLDLPYEKQPPAGRTVAKMPESEIFTAHPTATSPAKQDAPDRHQP
jgi:formylmethanofuran dehydrogenase subunit E